MAPVNIYHDYYMILDVPQTASADFIRSNYKRLALARHPDKNPANSNATSEFQLLQEAYSTLSNPGSRRVYDIRYRSIKTDGGSAAGARSPTDAPPKEGWDEKLKRTSMREKKLQQLWNRQSEQERDIFEGKRALKSLRAEIVRLQNEVDQIDRERAAKSSWWGYLTSMFPRKEQDIEQGTEESDRDRLNKLAARSIKESVFLRRNAEVERFETVLQQTKNEISRLKAEMTREKVEDEIRRKAEQEQAWWEKQRREEEQRKREKDEEDARRRAEQEKTRQEYERRREELRKQEQQIREEIRKREAKQRQQQAREERRREKVKPVRNPNSNPTSKSTRCRHAGWWERFEYPALCSRCSTLTRCFAFKCPGCNRIACSSCRDVLKRKG